MVCVVVFVRACVRACVRVCVCVQGAFFSVIVLCGGFPFGHSLFVTFLSTVNCNSAQISLHRDNKVVLYYIVCLQL